MVKLIFLGTFISQTDDLNREYYNRKLEMLSDLEPLNKDVCLKLRTVQLSISLEKEH